MYQILRNLYFIHKNFVSVSYDEFNLNMVQMQKTRIKFPDIQKAHIYSTILRGDIL